MHIEFQNGEVCECVNIDRITVNNEGERDILVQAVKEFDKGNREERPNRAKFKEGDIVVVVSEDCRLPKDTICVVDKALPIWSDSTAFLPYYIRNIESEYCCWVYEECIKEVEK